MATPTTSDRITALTAAIEYPTPAEERPEILAALIRLAIRLRADPQAISLLWRQVGRERAAAESAARLKARQ